MWPNPQFPPDLITFTEQIFNPKLHFLCSQLNFDQVYGILLIYLDILIYLTMLKSKIKRSFDFSFIKNTGFLWE